MKICTITSHWVYNYGASLQAFALQAYLKNIGHEVSIINYRPKYTKTRYNIFYYPTKGLKYKIVKYFPPAILFLWPYVLLHSGMLRTWKRKLQFDRFTAQYLQLTDIEYACIDELRKSPPKADVYIAGSDQIWNADMDNGKDPAYFLDFGSSDTKRISYAASVAMNSISEEQKKHYTLMLSKFDKISIREKTSIELLKEFLDMSITHVLDPVFLHEKDFWVHLSRKGKRYDFGADKYLLLYDFLGNDKAMLRFAQEIAKRKKLKIVSLIDFRGHSFADYNITDAGPIDFLSLINGAEIVVSSSFHATAFSIILQKEFYVFQIKLKHIKNNSRMVDLLSQFGLSERMNPQEISSSLINYKDKEDVLHEKINFSKYFINSYLHSIDENSSN